MTVRNLPYNHSCLSLHSILCVKGDHYVRLDLTDKSKQKSMIRNQRSNDGRILAWIYRFVFICVFNIFFLYFLHVGFNINFLEFKLNIVFIHVIYRWSLTLHPYSTYNIFVNYTCNETIQKEYRHTN